MIVLLASIILTVTACTNQASKDTHPKDKVASNNRDPLKDSAVIIGKLRSGELASFFFADEFGDTEPPFFISKNDSIKKLNFQSPTLLIDSYNQIPYLIYPEEHLRVTISKNKMLKIVIEGNETRNNELNFFVEQGKEKDFLFQQSMIQKSGMKAIATNFNFSEWEKSAERRHKLRLEFLDEYNKKNVISKEFLAYTSTLYQYLYVCERLSPTQLKNVDYLNLPQDYVSSLDSLIGQLACDSCLDNLGYRMAAKSFQAYIAREFNGYERYPDHLYDTTSKSFSGETRRYLLFSLLKKNLYSVKSRTFKKYLDNFLLEKNDQYSAYLGRYYEKIKKLPIPASATDNLSDSNGEPLSWDKLVDRNRSKNL